MTKTNKIAISLLGLLIVAFVALPAVGFAQLDTSNHIANSGGSNISNIGDLINKIEQLIATVFSAIAVIMFVIAGILFLTAGGNAEKVQEARAAAIWGVAGVVIGIIAFSIVGIVSNFLSSK